MLSLQRLDHLWTAEYKIWASAERAQLRVGTKQRPLEGHQALDRIQDPIFFWSSWCAGVRIRVYSVGLMFGAKGRVYG